MLRERGVVFLKTLWKSLIVCMFCFFNILLPYAQAEAIPIQVHYNAINIQLDEKAFEGNHFVYEGTIYLPIRSLAETLGFPVHFYNQTKTAYIGQLPEDELPEELVNHWRTLMEPPKRNPETIEPAISKNISVILNPITIKVDGRIVETDNILYQSITYVPMRAIAEMLDIEVVYHEPDQTAFFGNPPDVLTNEDWISVLSLSRTYHIFYLSHDPDAEMYVFYDHINQQDIEYIHVPDSILHSTKQEWVADGIRIKRLGETLFFHREDLVNKGIIPSE